MIKYITSQVTFEELPTEVTLSLSISNCQNRCLGCHSPELRGNIWIELTDTELKRLINKNSGVNCVLLLGEGNEKGRLVELAGLIRSIGLKAALYSGRDKVEEDLFQVFDYIKVGRWDERFGPLNSRTTNQILYKIENNQRINITEKFWKNEK